MTRKKKTPPFMIEMLKRHAAGMDWVDEMIRVKMTVPVDSQANHIKDHDIDYFVGLADGQNAMMENALHSYGCYAGFQNVGPKVTTDGVEYRPWVGSAHSDYRGWRRVYCQRGV